MKLETLEKEHYYHIYNRGINSSAIFDTNENKSYFLKLTQKYLKNKAAVLAYCLMDNHFHLVVQINVENKEITQAFSNLFNAYVKAYNKSINRTGSLFEKHFKRKKIDSDGYLKNTILYIHKNPQYHNVISDFSKYQFSSYKSIISKDQTIVDSEKTILVFDDLKNFIFTHKHGNSEDLEMFIKEKISIDESENDKHKNSKPSNTYKVLKTLQDKPTPLKNQKEKFYKYIEDLQNKITSKLEVIDGGGKFKEDIWKRKEGGGGKTRVIENGNVFEKGGVNVSAVHGELPEVLRKQFKVEHGNFFACGLSLVLHPKNPFVPTVHANWRYFEMYDETGNIVTQWFGGGQDLTPYYLFEEDAIHFHSVCKKACDQHSRDFYPKFKKNCDEYFWNPHRNEARGVGGLFFDYLKKTDAFSMEDRYNFVTEISDSFLESYIPIVEKRKNINFTKAHKDWQEIRRGRYVEFNLVHDRGTLFGLKTNGRIESILMSLPPTVQWKYSHQPKKNTEEDKLLKVLLTPKEWI